MKNTGHITPLEFEPKRKNRWVLEFPEDFNIKSFFVSETERPSFFCDNYGKLQVKPINIKFLDAIGPSTSQSLFKLIEKINNNELNTFTYIIEMLDPTGVVIEKWAVSDCSIVSIDFGKLDYESSEIMKCSMVIQPKNIKLIF